MASSAVMTTTSDGKTEKLSGRLVAFIALCAFTVVGWAPVASVVVAGVFASVFGCRLDEGNSHPCVVAGIDWGEILYTLGVAGWLMLVTWPLMLLTLVAWFAVGILYVMRRLQARRARA